MTCVTRRRLLAAALVLPLAGTALAASPTPATVVFESIDGGSLDLADYRGGPVLLVNTASRCGFTPQYEGLQALWERYSDRGLTVVGVPSQSFGQELETNAAVKDFCEVVFSVDFPMTGLVAVTGGDAHPFYAWLAGQGYAPAWNFHKVLLDSDGRPVAQWGSSTDPDAPELAAAIEALLPN